MQQDLMTTKTGQQKIIARLEELRPRSEIEKKLPQPAVGKLDN
jgi:hypothetical protein